MNMKILPILLTLALFLYPADEKNTDSIQTAKDVLKKALEVRGGQVKDLQDLKVELDFKNFSEEGDRIDGELTLFYKEPGMIRREVKDCFTGEITIEGYEGKRGWMKNEEGVTIYKGRAHYTANKNLKKELEQFKVFLKVFFLEPFLDQGGTLRIDKSLTASNPKDYIITGKDKEGISWKIEVGKDDFVIRRVERLPAGGKLEVYSFAKKCVFNGIRFPRLIEIVVGKKKRFEAGLKNVEVNLKLQKEIFQPPKK